MHQSPHDRETDLERELRHLVEPDAVTVERMIAHALGGAQRARPPRGVPQAVALVAVAVAVALVAVAWQWRSRPAPRGSEDTVSITGTPAFVVVERGQGERWIVTPASDDVPAGGLAIVVER